MMIYFKIKLWKQQQLYQQPALDSQQECMLQLKYQIGQIKEEKMAKIEKYVKQVDYLWYHADITDEQLAEWKQYESGSINEPNWVYDLDFTLVEGKTGFYIDYEFELIEDE